MPTSTSLSFRRLISATSLPFERIPSAFHVITLMAVARF
jgi:hypothetical protein